MPQKSLRVGAEVPRPWAAYQVLLITARLGMLYISINRTSESVFGPGSRVLSHSSIILIGTYEAADGSQWRKAGAKSGLLSLRALGRAFSPPCTRYDRLS